MARPSAIAAAIAAQTKAASTGTGLVPAASPLVMGYSQWVAGRQIGPALPRPFDEFLAGAFGPLSPLVPMPIDEPDDSGRPQPRRWQYPVGWNLPVGQPGTEGIKLASFAALRRYADVYSVVRAMLNIRKEEMAGLTWDIGQTDEAQSRTKGDKGAIKDAQKRANEIVEWFKRIDPDYYGFQSWFTAALEDQFVIDALALYLHPTRVPGKGLFGSDLAHLVLINGETIRPLVDIKGGTPKPPYPAYQQYLWGVPRADLTAVIVGDDIEEMERDLRQQGIDLDGKPEQEYRADQLLYLPRTRRSWTPYGFSPVEQAIMPISIGMKRQEFLLDFFTEGTIPGVYVIAGDQYVTPAQQRQLQDSLNALAGDQAWKHRVIVLPPGSRTDAQKDLSWQSSVDTTVNEQLMMILHIQPSEIGLTPGGGSSGLGGKGLAEAQQDATTQTRTIPERKWWKETVFDWIIQKVFRQDDLEWKWVDFETDEERAMMRAEQMRNDIMIGRVSIDESRIEVGLDPWNTPYTSKPFLMMGPQIVPLDPSVPPYPAPPDPMAGMMPPGMDTGLEGGVSTEMPIPMDKKGNPILGPGPGLPPEGEEPKGPGKGPKPKPPTDGGAPGQPLVDANGQPLAQPAVAQPAKPPAKPAKKTTVADLLKGKVRYKGDLTDIVHGYLLRSYPKRVVKWVKDGEWEFEPKVHLADINMNRRPGGRNPDKVESMVERFDKGATIEPIVIVEREDQSEFKYDIADGWHRCLAARQSGIEKLPAFIGIGFKDADEWGIAMQDESASVKKAAYAELAVLRRYLKRGGDITKFRTTALDSDVLRLVAGSADKMVGLDLARGFIDKAGGNPDALREYYNDGADGRIEWGEAGDWQACVDIASKYMTEEEAHGFCQLRHMDATGMTTGEHRSAEKDISLGAPLATSFAPFDLAGAEPSPCPECGERDCDHRVSKKEYDPSQPRDEDGKWTDGPDMNDGPEASEGGTGRAGEAVRAFAQMPIDKAGSAAGNRWIRENQQRYATDRAFRVLADTVASVAQGSFNDVRMAARFALGENPAKVFTEWRNSGVVSIDPRAVPYFLPAFQATIENGGVPAKPAAKLSDIEVFNDRTAADIWQSGAEDAARQYDVYERLMASQDKPLTTRNFGDMKNYFDGQNLDYNAEGGPTLREGALALLNAISEAPPFEQPLYRGVDINQYSKLPEPPSIGSIIDITGPSSFSANEDTAERFAAYADRGQHMGHNGRPNWDASLNEYHGIIYKVEPGARGVPASALSPFNQYEVLTNGRFEVTNVETRPIDLHTPNGVYQGRTAKEFQIITLKQVDTFNVD